MVKVAICDDNPEHLHLTEEFVRKELSSYSTEISLFSDARELTDRILQGYLSPDIAVLDVVLGKENGIECAKTINRHLPGCGVIFLTGYSEYASACYEADHVWFVLKSVAESYLGQALHRALAVSAGGTEKIGILAKAGGRSFFVPLGEVLCLSRVARKTQIVCEGRIFSVPGAPRTLINEKASPFFVRCHQGYWVNLQHVSALEKNEFVLTDGSRIPISRSFREEARDRFFAALSR